MSMAIRGKAEHELNTKIKFWRPTIRPKRLGPYVNVLANYVTKVTKTWYKLDNTVQN
jgi:hypothetical protein